MYHPTKILISFKCLIIETKKRAALFYKLSYFRLLPKHLGGRTNCFLNRMDCQRVGRLSRFVTRFERLALRAVVCKFSPCKYGGNAWGLMARRVNNNCKQSQNDARKGKQKRRRCSIQSPLLTFKCITVAF